VQRCWSGGGARGSASAESLSVDTRGGGSAGPRDDSSRLTTVEFSERGESLSSSSEPFYGSMRVFMTKVLGTGAGQSGEERTPWYSACPKCNKKVVGDSASGHNCESCGWSGAEPVYRYILPVAFTDADGQIVCTAFNETANSLLGVKADDLKRYKDASQSQYEAAIAQGQWKHYILRARGKMETYNDKTRLKSHVYSATPVKFVEEGKLLLSEIAKYGALEAAA